MNNFFAISFVKMRIAQRFAECYIIDRKSKTSAQAKSSGSQSKLMLLTRERDKAPGARDLPFYIDGFGS